MEETYEHGAVTADLREAKAGDKVTLTITADDGFVPDFVRYNDTDISSVDGMYFFDMPTSDVVISVLFVPGGLCGEDGDNLAWRYLDGTLTISGTGAMAHYQIVDLPWADYRQDITKIIFEDGITSIADYAFDGCEALSELELPGSVTGIGLDAFCGCAGVSDVYIHATDFSGYGFEDGSWVDDFNSPSATVLHIPVAPEDLTAESGNSIYLWYAIHPESISFEPYHTVSILEVQGGVVTAELSEAAEGDEVRIRALPEEDYYLDSISVTDSKGNAVRTEKDGDGTYVFAMPGRNVNVLAHFERGNRAIITVEGEGTVTADNAVTAAGETVTLTRKAGKNHKLVDFSVTDSRGNEVAIRKTQNEDVVSFAMPEGGAAIHS